MSEDKKTIYCTQCGSENDVNSKFCSNCGSRLERASALAEPSEQKEGVFSGGETKPVYEKITDAEEEKPTPIPVQDEIKISYGPDSQGYNSSSNSYNNSSYNNYYDTNQTQYYSSGQDMEKQGGGNIGFAIASLVCGICSLLCCCLTLFSAVLAVAAVVLGIITICFKYDGKGMAIAGIITGGFAVMIAIVAMIASGTSAYRTFLNELTDELYY
ncbi:MAG: zinc-ribbon domain-containing protein [Lachnospiraceae bacterium]|jgi:hypothetical protein|nr:zinc-ribbon domain-containing protein [Lachnospiraceae bacterium]GFI15450.1 hypothetical protein IMSAGC009_00609 [Lachnospiraceae bacterium]